MWQACLGGWLQAHKYKVKDFGPGLSKPFAACHKRSDETWEELRCEGKIYQDNLLLVREILEEIEDSTKDAPINLDQSKAFDRVDHRFLATVFETAGFIPEFYKWISMMYLNPQAAGS